MFFEVHLYNKSHNYSHVEIIPSSPALNTNSEQWKRALSIALAMSNELSREVLVSIKCFT